MSTSSTPRGQGKYASFDRVTEALEAAGLRLTATKGRTGRRMACCPVHDDATPSLNVTWRDGKTLLTCHGCHAPALDIAEAIGLTLADLFDEPLDRRERPGTLASAGAAQRRGGKRRGRLGRLPAPIARASPGPDFDHSWRESVRYPYVTSGGELVQEVVREECEGDAQHAAHKRFRQRFLVDGEWASQKPASWAGVLYRLPQVQAAIAAGTPVWLVEGEKDVATAEANGLVATTNAQGALSFDSGLAGQLAGANVVIVLDRDAAGWARALAVSSSLTDAGVASLKLRLPVPEHKGADLTDHVEAGHAVEALLDVHLDEVKAWAQHAEAESQAKRIDAAVAEVDAHLALVDHGATNEEAAQEHRRLARRWAQESELRYETLLVPVRAVRHEAARLGTMWVGEADTAVAQLLERASREIRRAHEAAQLALPAALRAATPGLAPPDETAALAAGKGTAAEEHSRAALEATAERTGLFRVIDGQIMRWEEREDAAPKLTPLLDRVVKVTVREFIESSDAEDADTVDHLQGRSSSGRRRPQAPRQLVAVRVTYVDDATGELMELRVPADAWQDRSWVESLPPSDFDRRRSGLDVLTRAILNVSAPVDRVLHRSTGWREEPGGCVYVHARGVITAAGHEEREVELPGPLRRVDLPDPADSPEALRRAFWEHSAGMLDAVPSRVAAPLLGSVWRSMIGHNPWALTLVGPKGSYKTALASAAMCHLGETWHRDQPATSMSGNGGTLNAIRQIAHRAKDAVLWCDDFAPTAGWAKAQTLLEETVRMLHNRESRYRSSRDGLSITDGTPPRASGLLTSEVAPRPGSGAERMMLVPFTRADIDTTTLFPLDDEGSRFARALVGASFLSWLARDLRGARGRYARIERDYSGVMQAAGEQVRAADAVASTWAGWVAMTDAMTGLGALTAEEREGLLRRVDESLRAAVGAAHDPDMPTTTGARIVELLRHGLTTGIAYVDDARTGDCPPWPLAGRLGWRRTITDTSPNGDVGRVRYDRAGQRFGFVVHDPGPRDRRGRTIMCESTALEAVLRAAGASQIDRLEVDRSTAQRALAEENVLITDLCEGGKTRYTLKCSIPAMGVGQPRMVVLRLDDILGDDPDTDDAAGPDEDGGGPDGPAGEPAEAPRLPGLDRADGTPQILDTEQATAQAAPDVDVETREEDHVQFVFTPVAYFDVDGLIGYSENPVDDPGGTCVVCGRTCSMRISGARIHALCWQTSGATARAGGRRPVDEHALAPAAQPAPAPCTHAPTANPRSSHPTSTPPARPETPRPAGFRAAAAIVDEDQVTLSCGEVLPAEPIRHIGDLVRLAQRLQLGTQVTRYLPTSGQIWIGDGLARRLGIDVDALHEVPDHKADETARRLTANAPGVVAALEEGYRLGRDGASLGRWTRCWLDEGRSVWLVLMAALPRSADDLPLIADDPDAATLARRIKLFADALGAPFVLSGSTTGMDLLRATRWKDRDRFFVSRPPVPPAELRIEPDLSWCRTPTTEESTHEWVHAYDRSGSYLAGVSGLDLPLGEPAHHPDGTDFQPKTLGYWRLEIPPTDDWRAPSVLDPVAGRGEGLTRWVTTPSLALAVEYGLEPKILEAYTWPDRARVLDPWYERIRDARTRLDVADADAQVARDQLKLVYAPTIGMLGSEQYMAGKDLYQPAWRHFIVAKSRANVIRRIHTIGEKTGRWPVAATADTIIYTSSSPDPEADWPGGARWYGKELGRYRHEGSVALADQLEHLTGGPYRGKDALMGRLRGGDRR